MSQPHPHLQRVSYVPPRRWTAAMVLLAGAASLLLLAVVPTSSVPKRPPAATAKVSESYGKLPLAFEENRGQVDAEVRFLTRGPAYHLFLTPTEAVFSLFSAKENPASKPTMAPLPDRLKLEVPEVKTTVLRMKMVGANPIPMLVGEDELPGKVNYFIGNNSHNWLTGIPTFSTVVYKGVWQGISVKVRMHTQTPELIFILDPHANPQNIAFSVDSSDKLHSSVNNIGDLIFSSSSGEIVLKAPIAYLINNNNKSYVACKYRLLDDATFAFETEAYDASKSLIIDPYVYANSRISVDGSTTVTDIVFDRSDNIILVGGRAYIARYQPATKVDAFVTKLNSSGTITLFTTYIGGSSSDAASKASIDKYDNIYFVGSTESPDFPLAIPKQNSLLGTRDGFYSCLDPSGSTLITSSYLGGSKSDDAIDIELSPDSHYFAIIGNTNSSDYPLVNNYQAMLKGAADAFISVLDTNNNTMYYSTYLGGSDSEEASTIKWRSISKIATAGKTSSKDFPLSNPIQLRRQKSVGFSN